jgi:Protein of unknown function (DUF1360)
VTDLASPVSRRSPAGPRLEEVIVIAFAAARLARAISVDEITGPWRARLQQTAKPPAGRRRAVNRFVADLVNCPVCTGWWASLAVSALWPGTQRLRRGVSVAGVQVLLTLAERLVSEQGRVAVGRANSTETSGQSAPL